MPMATPAPAPAASSGPTVGGHVGIAIPLVTVHSKGKTTTSLGDEFILASPIGISVHLSKDWTFDFETVVANHISGDNVGDATFTSFTVDPGIVYTGGPVALGLRVKWYLGSGANIGIIPLVNYGLVKFDGGVWFIEAAFPTTISDIPMAGQGSAFSFQVVAHTGVGF